GATAARGPCCRCSTGGSHLVCHQGRWCQAGPDAGMIVLESRASVALTRLLAGLDIRGIVLLPSNVCTAVPLACLAAGHGVEFVDIDPRTLEIDLAGCEDRIRRD